MDQWIDLQEAEQPALGSVRSELRQGASWGLLQPYQSLAILALGREVYLWTLIGWPVVPKYRSTSRYLSRLFMY